MTSVVCLFVCGQNSGCLYLARKAVSLARLNSQAGSKLPPPDEASLLATIVSDTFFNNEHPLEPATGLIVRRASLFHRSPWRRLRAGVAITGYLLFAEHQQQQQQPVKHQEFLIQDKQSRELLLGEFLSRWCSSSNSGRLLWSFAFASVVDLEQVGWLVQSINHEAAPRE